MNYFSIQCTTVNNVAAQEKQLANQLQSIASSVSSTLGQISGSSALKSDMRSTLRSAANSISEQQGKMARLSTVLSESVAEYEATEKSTMQISIKTIMDILGIESNAVAVKEDKISVEQIWDAIRESTNGNLFLDLTGDAVEGVVVTAADGWQKLREIYGSDKSISEMITEGFKVFNDTVISPIKSYQTINEWISQEKFEWVGKYAPFKDVLKFVKKIDEGIDLFNAFKNYTIGSVTHDNEMAAEGVGGYAEFLIDVAMKSDVMKSLKSEYGFSPYNPVSLIVDYGTNMIQNWIGTIVQDGVTTQEVYYQTFMHSALEVGLDCVYNPTALAAAYYPLDAALGLVGVDLEGMYQNVSDKTGIAAVMDATGQLKDLILENSSWEGWKNGMSIMGDYISDGFKSIGDGAKNLWNKIF